MRNLLKYLKHYKLQSILAPLFKLLEAAFELFVPMVVSAIIDNGINVDGAGNWQYIVYACLILAVLGVVGLICGARRRRVFKGTQTRFIRQNAIAFIQ